MEDTPDSRDVIDLHCHSTASDGLLAPAAVVQAAAAIGLTAIALTDHDTTAGIAEARAAGERLGVHVVGGCEFSVAAPWGEMHLLGYFLEPGDPAIETFLAEARANRIARARAMLQKLHGQGILVPWTMLADVAEHGTVGRPHIARALHELGHVGSAQAAFDQWLRPGRPAWVEKILPPFAEVATLVHRSGGIVSAAHLRDRGSRAAVAGLQAEGLDAVETRHPSHGPDVVANLTEFAQALDLGRSGGSDWHGESDPKHTHARLGAMQVPAEWLEDLERRRPTREVG